LRQVLPPLSPAFPKLILLLQVLHAMLCLCELLLLLLWFLLILVPSDFVRAVGASVIGVLHANVGRRALCFGRICC